MADPRLALLVKEFRSEVNTARQAADADSNDGEIESLWAAVELAEDIVSQFFGEEK